MEGGGSRRSPRLIEKGTSKIEKEVAQKEKAQLVVQKAISKSRLRKSFSVTEFVTVGTPPVVTTALPGMAFRLSPSQRKLKDMHAKNMKMGVRKIHGMVNPDVESGMGYLNNPKVCAFIIKSVQSSVEAELKEMREEVKELRGVIKEIQDKPSQMMTSVDLAHLKNLVELEKLVQLRKVVDAWTSSKHGKDFRNRLTIAVNLKYQLGNHERRCDGEDVILECKTLLRRIEKAKVDGDLKAEETQSAFLEIVKSCIGEDITAGGHTGEELSPDGLLCLLMEYLRANSIMHEKLQNDTLRTIADKAKSGEYNIGQGNLWLFKFALESLT